MRPMRERRTRRAAVAIWIAACVVLGTACGPDDRVVREWRPEDHAEPGGGEPSGQAAPSEGEGEGEAAGSPAEQEARAVAALFGVSCAACHGVAGDGSGPSRPPGAQMASFTDPEWQGSHSDEQIAQVITEGRGLMPAFGTQVNPRGIAALVGHVRLLGGLRAPPSNIGVLPPSPSGPTAPSVPAPSVP